MYEAYTLETCLFFNSNDNPYSVVPHSLDINVRFYVPHLAVALIKFSGIPHSPNPPATILAPSNKSCVASSAFLHIFLFRGLGIPLS